MQDFVDPADNNKPWSFGDDVKAEQNETGEWVFTTKFNMILVTPPTLVPASGELKKA